MTPPLYQQVPLVNDQADIRLLTLFPAKTETDPVICQLSAVTLAQVENKYEALSYQWFGPQSSQILVNDIEILVGTSLFDALVALRLGDRPRTLWADALCIDQQSSAYEGEKCHQIRLMRSIYQNAARTVAWVGKAKTSDAGTHSLHELMDIIAEAVDKVESDEKIGEQLALNGVYHLSKEEMKTFGIPDPDDDDRYSALADLLDRPWWKRVWVIQEATLAKKTIIHCGPHKFYMTDLFEMLAFAWSALNAKQLMDIGTHSRHFAAQAEKQKRGHRDTLLSLAIMASPSEATLPHDKLYGLCGLARDVGPGKLNITFDYSTPFGDVYTDFARSVLLTSGNLDIFCALSARVTTADRSIPSWVPDWRSEAFAPFTLIYQRTGQRDSYDRGMILFLATSASTSKLRFDSSGKSLCLEGFTLDDIVCLGEPSKDGESEAEGRHVLLNWRNKIARCTTRWRYKPTDQRMVDVFYHTITMGNVERYLDNPLQEYRRFDRALRKKSKSLRDVMGSFFYAGRFMANRRMARTRDGYLCLVPQTAAVGDEIALFTGGALPLVVRKTTSDSWQMIGDTYVHGIMMGEAYDEAKCKPFWFN
ncbi:heterokaryon incompatibility protein-domain-containing protein [Podospora fimiseda]|uniref:Heterokaryon incompatibility protein-domain-containing protein n=1 Tax=Podospora fimiseda TaxID=252190 RepID=A0AAN6YKJ7_9PEZI|nr:heterokaryon incompatibility protein-domain-containing protein [Podospora fimiseda]